jgi:hypothetical protein
MSTPFELEQTRQKEQASIEKQSILAGQKTVNSNLIKDSTPEGLKLKGSAKLPLLIFNLSSQIPEIIQPSLEGLIQKYIPNINVCDSNININEFLIQRNNIVSSLNNIGDKVNKLGTSITGISNFLDLTLGVISAVDIASTAISLAAKAVPLIPGAVPAALNDIQTFIRKTTFDQAGNSKLSKSQGIINSSALVISITGVYILKTIELLDQIDNYMNTCFPEIKNDLTLISKDVKSIADSQKKAQQTLNQITYNGFIIDIEEIPYTPTVTRRKAVGRNAQGITLIQTELSFTTDTQTLINELKLIIDRDNLKAY